MLSAVSSGGGLQSSHNGSPRPQLLLTPQRTDVVNRSSAECLQAACCLRSGLLGAARLLPKGCYQWLVSASQTMMIHFVFFHSTAIADSGTAKYNNMNPQSMRSTREQRTLTLNSKHDVWSRTIDCHAVSRHGGHIRSAGRAGGPASLRDLRGGTKP